MARPSARLIVVVSAAVSATLVSGCTMGANYARPAVPTPAEYRFVQTAQAESMADLPWWEIFDDPVAARAHQGIDRGQPGSPGRGRAGRGSTRARGHRQVVPVSAGQFRRELRRQAGDQRANSRARPTKTPRIRTAITASSFSWEIDLFGRHPAPARGRGGGGPGKRTGSARRDGHARRRCGHPPTSCCGSWTCSSSRPGRRWTSTTRPSRISRIACRAACRTGSSWTASRPTGRRPRPRSPASSAMSRLPRTRCRCCWTHARTDRA